jgi:hypothetical protein
MGLVEVEDSGVELLASCMQVHVKKRNSKMAKTSGDFRFRRGDRVGAADAENDSSFLDSCFVDNGDVATLLDCSNPHCIVLGRTGSGKTTLLLEIEKRAAGRVERIEPESLSMNYIANSDVIHSLMKLGVNLDPFLKLLWRHVLAMQIFQHIRPISATEKKEGVIAWLTRILRDDKTTPEKRSRHKRVMEFLKKYGSNEFWGDVGHRIKGIVTTFENEVGSEERKTVAKSRGAENRTNYTSAEDGNEKRINSNLKESSEISIEERQRFQCIVNEMQVKDLDGILDLVKEVLEDAGRNIYIIIDKLDLQWSDEQIRFRLIRALIDTAIAFNPISRVKIIIAMRVDLLERVYKDARFQPGTQTEKLRDYCLILNWDSSTLRTMADERINKLCADRYAPNYKVKLKDVMNPNIKKGKEKGIGTFEFIIERTWKRPRDLIDFLNACIERSSNKPQISDDAVLEAEGEYSRNRIRSLAEEWQLEYPFLEETMRTLFNGCSRRVRVHEITDARILEWQVMIESSELRESDRMRPFADLVEAGKMTHDELRVELAALLYRVGCVGIQTDETEKPQWASNLSYSLSPAEIRLDAYLYVHPGLWKALGAQ